METLKLFSILFILGGAWLFTGNDDYHKRFDKEIIVRYNCNTLSSLSNPDVPREVIDKCRSGERESVYVKTYQE